MNALTKAMGQSWKAESEGLEGTAWRRVLS